MGMDVIGWRSPHIHRFDGAWYVYYRGVRRGPFAQMRHAWAMARLLGVAEVVSVKVA